MTTPHIKALLERGKELRESDSPIMRAVYPQWSSATAEAKDEIIRVLMDAAETVTKQGISRVGLILAADKCKEALSRAESLAKKAVSG